MSSPPLTIGLTGCGTIGALHAGQLSKRGVDLRFHNRSPSTADEFVKRFGGAAVRTYDELLEQCDAVVIASPPEHHMDAVLVALAAGRDVLVEKPLCVTAAELQRVDEAEATSGGFVMIAENYYYKPSTLLLRETLIWGGVGAVERIRLGKRSQQVAQGWKAAHGALLEGGIHFVALAGDLIDAAISPHSDTPTVVSPSQVTARFPTYDSGPERQSIVSIGHAGIEVELHYAWDVPSVLKGTLQHCRIDGIDGRIVFECNGIYVDIRGPGRRGLSFPGFRDLMGYGAMTEDFLACVRRESSTPYSDIPRARRDLQIVWRAYEDLPSRD